MTRLNIRQRLRDWLLHPIRLTLVRDYLLIIVGTTIQAAAMHLFFIPGELVAGGLSGTAQLIYKFTGWPIGTMILIGNIPLIYLGWRFLGGRRFLARTIFASVVYSIVVDLLPLFLPRDGLTHDFLLNALYGGVIGGIGAGLVFQAQATTGGTDILARLLDRKFGIPLSQSYMYTDGLVVFLAALAFSWEHALYAVIALYIGGVVMETVTTGSNVVRVATIVTNKPEEVAQAIIRDLVRGVTNWTGKGMYSGQPRHILFCVVSRAEIVPLKAIIHEVDPDAFVVIGQAQEALGEGFRPIREP
ncbi:MAG: YitT family protein [Chloroflexi bacterium]|nr:YitT family protein [Chloroflexota bacterium]MBP8059669.1 YitT family protein [Chloroflexota bacterium]